MTNPISYIGATIGIVASSPATIDSSGFGALSYTTIGEVVSWGAVGDQTDNISIPLLNGRVKHVNGAADGGEIAWTVRYEAADGGQVILNAQNNTQTNCSIKITDPDGKIAYTQGLVANVKDMDRATGNYKGLTGVFRVNTPTIRV
jgi:hypothetical protein